MQIYKPKMPAGLAVGDRGRCRTSAYHDGGLVPLAPGEYRYRVVLDDGDPWIHIEISAGKIWDCNPAYFGVHFERLV